LGGPWAAALGAAALLSIVGWVSDFMEPSSEPLLVAFTLAASELHLRGREGAAFTLGGLAALIRPEAWFLLAAYATRLRGAARPTRVAIACALVAIPVLWLLPDWLASGSPLTG